ncbi:MAG TPA: alkaline phosphatase [Thermotogota bacterium]|nr:alkaline phosphatase [Thermotogota bacterium]
MKKVLMTVAIVLLLTAALFAQGPKYVFLFIGDGMAMPQSNAAQLLESSLANVETPKLTMFKFPVQGMTTTHAANAFITDSAAAGTALATGYKTNSGVIGFDPTLSNALETIAERVNSMGWKVGVVSTVSIDHATPAAFYAHQASRSNYYEIARQLAESGFAFFGGGDIKYPTGKGKDQENVYEMAKTNGYEIINTQAGYEAFDPKNPGSERVWIINEDLDGSKAMNYAVDNAPTFDVADITKTAIDFLDNDKGFFLMVEGGKIDWACHANDAAGSIGDTIAFDDAIAQAVEFYKENPEDTLIVVTGDHETGGLTIGFAGTQYAAYPELIANQKGSYDVFTAKVNTMKASGELKSFEDVLPEITAFFGLYTEDGENEALKLSAYETEQLEAAVDTFVNGSDNAEEAYLLYGGYNPIAMTCTHILNNKAGLAWTTYSHTGVPVVTYAMGNGQEMFSGYYDNTDIAKYLFALVK